MSVGMDGPLRFDPKRSGRAAFFVVPDWDGEAGRLWSAARTRGSVRPTTGDEPENDVPGQLQSSEDESMAIDGIPT